MYECMKIKSAWRYVRWNAKIWVYFESWHVFFLLVKVIQMFAWKLRQQDVHQYHACMKEKLTFLKKNKNMRWAYIQLWYPCIYLASHSTCDHKQHYICWTWEPLCNLISFPIDMNKYIEVIHVEIDATHTPSNKIMLRTIICSSETHLEVSNKTPHFTAINSNTVI